VISCGATLGSRAIGTGTSGGLEFAGSTVNYVVTFVLPSGGNHIPGDTRSVRVDCQHRTWSPTLPGGSIHYGGFEVGETYPSDALDGRGAINGTDVRCEAAAWSLLWHTGYPARPVDFHDVRRLCARFDLELPEMFRSHHVPRPLASSTLSSDATTGSGVTWWFP
jgi:hypothetical protein